MAEVETRQDGAVLTVTLNRPEVLNALNRAAHAALRGGPRGRPAAGGSSGRAHRRRTRFLRRPGSSEFRAGANDVAERLRQSFNRHALAIRSLEKPVLAVVNGPAAGAGLALALACDVRIASDAASFVPAFVGIGLVPDTGATWFARRLLGAARAFEWLATGRRLTAAEALQWGLVSEVVPAAELADRAGEVAELFAAMPTRAVWETKRLLDDARDGDASAAARDARRGRRRSSCATPDFTEGVAAFLEKREAAFTGGERSKIHPIRLVATTTCAAGG